MLTLLVFSRAFLSSLKQVNEKGEDVELMSVHAEEDSRVTMRAERNRLES